MCPPPVTPVCQCCPLDSVPVHHMWTSCSPCCNAQGSLPRPSPRGTTRGWRPGCCFLLYVVWSSFRGPPLPVLGYHFHGPAHSCFKYSFQFPDWASELIPCEEELYSWLLKVKQETLGFSSTPGHVGCNTFELVYIHSFAFFSVFSQGCGWCSSLDCTGVTQHREGPMSKCHGTTGPLSYQNRQG